MKQGAYVVLEADDFGNERYAAELNRACAERGVLHGIWETAPQPSAGRVESFGAQVYVAEVESPSDCQALLDGPTPNVPHAIVTNFNGLTRESAQELRRRGYHCLPEADLPGNPNATPERVVARAHQEFGWELAEIQPVCYLNGGKTLADYGDLSRWPGYGAWLVEYLLA